MRLKTFARIGTVLIVLVVLISTSGCNRLLLGTNAVSFVGGWMFGNAFGASNVERLCYENGVLIDCADLPDDLGQ